MNQTASNNSLRTLQAKHPICFAEGFKLMPIRMSKEVFEAILQYTPKGKFQEGLYARIKSLVQYTHKSDFYLPSIAPVCERYALYLDPSRSAKDQRLKCWFDAANTHQVLEGWKNKLTDADEYIGFLANFISKMVECGLALEWAWHIVADDHRPFKEFLATPEAKTLPSNLIEELRIYYQIAISGKLIADSIYSNYSILTLHCKDCSQKDSPVSLYRALGEHNNPCKRDDDVFPGTYALLSFTPNHSNNKGGNYA